MAKRKRDQGGGEVPEFLQPLTEGMDEMRAMAGGEELPFGVNVVRASLLAGKKARTPQEASRLAVLHYAVDYGRVELLRKFLADGVDPNMKLFDETLLGLAAGKHHTAIVRELLKAGADPNRKSEGYPPILHAAGDPEQVKVMLEAGADPNAVGQDGSSVLVGAALAGSTEVVKLLLAHGADVNGSSSLYVSSRKPTKGITALMAALETGGMNESGTADVIRRLKQIEKDDPFVLTFISEDTVEGEFNEKVKTPARVAKKIYAICSDIVTQGTGTVAALAKELQRSRRLFLWWD